MLKMHCVSRRHIVVAAPAMLVIAVTMRMEIYLAKSPGNHITGHFSENTKRNVIQKNQVLII